MRAVITTLAGYWVLLTSIGVFLAAMQIPNDLAWIGAMMFFLFLACVGGLVYMWAAQDKNDPVDDEESCSNEEITLDAMPQTIECLEWEQQEVFQAMGDPGFYKKDRADIVATNDRLEELKRLLAEAYARWEELEQLRLDGENSRLSK